MGETPWFFPDNIPEAWELLTDHGARLHAGGTAVSKSMIEKWSAVIDISRLPIAGFKWGKDEVEIGAGMDINSVVKLIRKKNRDHLLVKALSRSSSQPLRNRISIGGSIASFPVWSDLLGPLIALDARIRFYAGKEETLPVVGFLKTKDKNRPDLITSALISHSSYKSYYYRETRVQFDYPAFTISIIMDREPDNIRFCRVVVIGTKNKYQVFNDLESVLPANSFKAKDHDRLLEKIELKFSNKELGSKEYIRHLAEVRILEGMRILLEESI